jgi:DNA replicative helicase MCM subunit Mcm2 (Cdc46/Mcm family)
MDKIEKAISVYEEILNQEKEHGRSVSIKRIKDKFEKDEFFKIAPNEVEKIISKIEGTGIISSYKKGFIERLNNG